MALSKEETNLLLGAGVLAAAYFGIVRPITNKLGLTQSQKDKAVEQIAEAASANQGWNPTFYRTYIDSHNTTSLIKTSASITAMAKQIYNAWGLVNDDVQKIYAVFRQLNSQVDLSWLCYTYNNLYKEDLLTRLKAPWYYLHDGLTDSEFAEVSKIVNALPVNKS